MAFLIIYVGFPSGFTVPYPWESVNLELILAFISLFEYGGFGFFVPDEQQLVC